MNLDCIEGSDLSEGDEAWVIIDYDNDNKVFATGRDPEYAWGAAAVRLSAMINVVVGVCAGSGDT